MNEEKNKISKLNKKNKKSFWSGLVSGTICGIIYQPLEVLKINMIILPEDLFSNKVMKNSNYFNKNNQTLSIKKPIFGFLDPERINLDKMATKFANKEKLKISLWNKFLLLSRYMYRTEGVLSFWRGLKPNVLRSGISSGLYFYQLRYFEGLFKRLQQKYKHNKYALKMFNESSVNFWASGIARSVTGTLLNPLTIIRTRAEIIGCREFQNIGSSMVKIYRKEGFRGYFKGGFMNILEEFPFGGIFNVIYEVLNRNSGIHFKNSINKTRSEQFRIIKKEELQLFLNATIAAVVASILTHPIEIAKTKIQSHKKDFKDCHSKSKMISIFKDTYVRFGLSGFYFGLMPRLLKKTFVNATVFFFYEVLSQRTKGSH